MIINFDEFFKHINNTHFKIFAEDFAIILGSTLERLKNHGDWQSWYNCLTALPEINPSYISLNQDTLAIGRSSDANPQLLQALRTQLIALHPWRKGPFNLFDIFIDCEWRSDWKWQRLAPHISNLQGRYVLDVGCGNGYHSMRMQAAGASCVIGIDPAAKFFLQYLTLKKYLGAHTRNLHFLPLRIEDLPENMQSFDSVFSMGVLYHRRSPFEHLDQLKQLLKSGGELILETLVIEGGKNTVLVPQDRYANMRNVWFLPSVATLEDWLQRAGWKNIRTVNTNITCIEEQRATAWMHFHSLKDFLDPHAEHLTIEGYPAPMRAITIANK